jgi:hypothetical protein
MSTKQRNDACRIAVGPQVADVLRVQTLAVLEANHHHFEELGGLAPSGQLALAAIYRDAFAVLDALGWAPPTDAAVAAATPTVDVPLTAGHADELRACRYDLARTNLDRLDTLRRTTDPAKRAAIREAIDADRTAGQALDRLLSACRHAMRT